MGSGLIKSGKMRSSSPSNAKYGSNPNGTGTSMINT
jgi:hypothetical protein